MKKIILIGILLVLTGCTSIQVNNINGFNPSMIRQVCVINNPKVTIKGFDEIIVRSLARYNVESTVLTSNQNTSMCQTTLKYVALRSWDFTPYLVSADFNLYQNNRLVSSAAFKLKGKGGLSPNKWRSTETKVNELVDELMGKNDQSREKPLQLSSPPKDLS